MKFLIISICFISIVGTLSHFLYDLSKHNKFVGLFAAVNESTWEHIKIALTPTILWSLVDGYIFGSNPNYFVAKFISLLVIVILIPLLYYGYKTLFKKDSVFFNVSLFYIAIILSQISFNKIINLASFNFICQYLSCIGFVILIGAYMVLTLYPIKNIIFKDPLTKKYGYKGHKFRFFHR